jgi:hypothetical protein
MKKIILATCFAIAALSVTSCNKVPAPINYTPQAILALNIAELMKHGLFEVFAYEEIISTKISNGEILSDLITVNKDASDNVTGWEATFSGTEIFGGKMTVEYESLTDGEVRHIDCSQLTIPYWNVKMFGTVSVENYSTHATETVRQVTTNSFGWGKTANDISLNANYTFNCKWNTESQITECKISGGSNGHHVEYLDFVQLIETEMNVGLNSYFTAGSMTLFADGIGDGILPIDVEFTPNNMIVRYNGNTETY